MSDVWEGFLGGVGEGLIDAGKYVIKDSFEQKAYARREAVQQAMWEERNAITDKQANKRADLNYERDLSRDELKNDRAVEAAKLKEEGLDRRNREDNRTKESVQKLKNITGDTGVPAQVVSGIREAEAKIKSVDAQIKAVQAGDAEGNLADLQKIRAGHTKVLNGYSRSKDFYERGDETSGAREAGDIIQWRAQLREARKRASQEP